MRLYVPGSAALATMSDVESQPADKFVVPADIDTRNAHTNRRFVASFLARNYGSRKVVEGDDRQAVFGKELIDELSDGGLSDGERFPALTRRRD